MLSNSNNNTNNIRSFSAIKIDKTTTKPLYNFNTGTHIAKLINNVKQMSSITSTNDPKSNVTVIDLGKMLLQSARDGELNKVHELISRGAPFSTDWLGMTPLHFAAINNHLKICEILLRGGVNKDAKTKVDRTPLHLAVYEGHTEIVELLLSQNCDVNPKDMLRMTPLHWAIERKHITIARMLLSSGAQVDVISKFDKTPIFLAIQTGQTDLLDELSDLRDNQKNAEKLRSDENQNETNQAVNSITFDNNNTQFDSDMYELCDHDDSNYKQKINEIKNIKTGQSDIKNQSKKDESQSVEDPATLEMVKNLKSLIPPDDPENNDLLSSALQNGRKLVLSEGGLLALNEAAKNHYISDTINLNNLLSNNNNKRKLSTSENDNNNDNNYFNKILTTNSDRIGINGTDINIIKSKIMPLKSAGKSIKILSMDMYKKLYGKDAIRTLKKISPNTIRSSPTQQQQQQNNSITKITKITNLNEINAKKAIFNRPVSTPIPLNNNNNTIRLKTDNIQPYANQPQQQQQEQSEFEDTDELPPNIIEVCTDDSDEEMITETIPEISSNGTHQLKKPRTISMTLSTIGPTITTNPSIKPQQIKNRSNNPLIPLLDLPEICVQLHELKKENEDLKRELSYTRQECLDYRLRLERLERNFESLEQ